MHSYGMCDRTGYGRSGGKVSLAHTISEIASKRAAADAALPIDRVIRQIANRHFWLARFWAEVKGWAPLEAAEMLRKARLDRLTALAWSLRRWPALPEPMDEGDLILAWANLGALVEGALKLMLCVYLKDFIADETTGQGTGAYHGKKKKMLDPDGLRLDVVIAYYEKRKLLSEEHLNLARQAQSYRNVIHAFKSGDLGHRDDLIDAIRSYRSMLREISGRLPYPDDMYEPRETGPYDTK